jgi:hypothetical protein
MPYQVVVGGVDACSPLDAVYDDVPAAILSVEATLSAPGGSLTQVYMGGCIHLYRNVADAVSDIDTLGELALAAIVPWDGFPLPLCARVASGDTL